MKLFEIGHIVVYSTRIFHVVYSHITFIHDLSKHRVSYGI